MPFRDPYQAQGRAPRASFPSCGTMFLLKTAQRAICSGTNLTRHSRDIPPVDLPLRDRRRRRMGSAAMTRIKVENVADRKGARVTEHMHSGAILRLPVIAEGAQIKIEVQRRGVVYEPSAIPVTDAAKDAVVFRNQRRVLRGSFRGRADCCPRGTASPWPLPKARPGQRPARSSPVFLLHHNRPERRALALGNIVLLRQSNPTASESHSPHHL